MHLYFQGVEGEAPPDGRVPLCLFCCLVSAEPLNDCGTLKLKAQNSSLLENKKTSGEELFVVLSKIFVLAQVTQAKMCEKKKRKEKKKKKKSKKKGKMGITPPPPDQKNGISEGGEGAPDTNPCLVTFRPLSRGYKVVLQKPCPSPGKVTVDLFFPL